MPPKKSKGGSAKEGEEEDVSVDTFYKFYRKFCT